MKNFMYLVVFLSLAFTSCQDDDSETDSREFEPSTVMVKTYGSVSTVEMFNLINSYDLDVDNIDNEAYVSSLSSDKFDYVKQYFSTKPYINNTTWPVTGYLHYQTNEITIFPRLFNITNLAHQADFLQAMQVLQLTEKGNGHIIMFKVPEGQETKWAKHFRGLDGVEWAELNYYSEVILHNN